jgi:hypothetical protein
MVMDDPIKVFLANRGPMICRRTDCKYRKYNFRSCYKHEHGCDDYEPKTNKDEPVFLPLDLVALDKELEPLYRR